MEQPNFSDVYPYSEGSETEMEGGYSDTTADVGTKIGSDHSDLDINQATELPQWVSSSSSGSVIPVAGKRHFTKRKASNNDESSEG